MMEMDSNPITKPSKKGTIISAVFYASLSRASLCREMNWLL